ncbi:unnamed protein product [Durusdinium trenchii]|uniref:Uncharacterized protein n=1 Tax=Durusdinium trenchii TaxID=1381693 RepID=A0ABP0HG20_9DINO
MGLLWLRRLHEFGSPSGGHQKYFQQKASESSAMVALLWLRCWLCMLLFGVYGSHFSTRAELRDALLQCLGLLAATTRWRTADEATKLQLTSLWGAPGEWNVSAVTNMSGLFKDLDDFNENISAWDTSKVQDMSFMFHGATVFNMPIGAWNTSSVKTMHKMFFKASSFNEPIDAWYTGNVRDMKGMFASSFDQPIGAWDTGNVRTMNGMFYNAAKFNQPIGSWNTSEVVDMKGMFYGASSFDQPIGAWDTSNVENMRNMFSIAVAFNQSMGSWKTSAVENMEQMFYGASSFDQPIGAWDTGNVRTMKDMFYNAAKFNQPIGSWNTSAVGDMSFLFSGASSFDQPIGAWETGKVRDMKAMFAYAAKFNQPIGSWNTSAVTDMSSMFIAADSFNQPIGGWDTSQVNDMSYMFERTVAFDRPLNHWETKAVTNFSGMFFRASSFNQPVGLWDTSAATDMYRMFAGAQHFDQSVSTWNLTSIPDAQAMAEAFTGSGMSTCVLRLSSEASGLPPSIRQTWQYQLCPGCPCQNTNLACVDEACRPVNSGFIELGRGAWDDRNASLTTAVGFRACVERCKDLECGAFLLEDSGRCWLMDDMNDQSELSLIGGSGRSYLAFRRASCRTFSCLEGTTRATTSLNASAATATVTAASCCRCAARKEVPIRSKEPDLECQSCAAGQAPKDDRCEACASGFAQAGAVRCEDCPPGEVPVLPSRTDCRACAPDQYSDGDMCRSCSFPLLLLDNTCVWWHLVLIIFLLALSSGIIFLLQHMAKRHRRKRADTRQEEVSQILQEFEDELWDEKPETLNRFMMALSSFGWSCGQVSERAQEIRARHSSHAGVSLAYLMGDFARLAYDWSGEENPTFLRLKEVFWQGDEKLGSNIRCPRDGRPGCALVDWLPREHRRLQTHFMSWSWKYSLQQLQSAMEMWRSTRTLEFEDIFFYMCFCVNNQFRIIVEGSATGSDNLEEVFQTNLRRIGQVVAVLDTWEEPVYLQRVWTIYEQYVACSLQVPVTFVMPEDAAASLSKQISRGDAGIEEVTQSLCDVDVAAARAFDPRDEQKVKTTIQSTVGFDQVNQHVKDAMIQWICVVVREKFQRLINRADREDVFSV